MVQLTNVWLGFEGILNGHPFLVRAREDMNNIMQSGLYNHRVDIVWKYNPADDSMMPDMAQMELMEQAEGSLAVFLENDLHAVLSFVYLGNGQKVWYWYSKDIEETAKRINGALEHFGSLPVELYSNDDPDWQQYKTVMKDMAEK